MSPHISNFSFSLLLLFSLLTKPVHTHAKATLKKPLRLWGQIFSETLTVNDVNFFINGGKGVIGYFFTNSICLELGVSTVFFSDITSNFKGSDFSIRYYPLNQTHPIFLQGASTRVSLLPSYAYYAKLEYSTRSINLNNGSRTFNGFTASGGLDWNRKSGPDFNFEAGLRMLSAPKSANFSNEYNSFYLSVGVGKFF